MHRGEDVAAEGCDGADDTEQFLADAIAGLRHTPKTLPCKYLYDERGSLLFERICELDAYYPTRTELAIMERHAAEMAESLGERCLLVEYGSGSSLKTRLLLDHLPKPSAYVPVDISGEHLEASARSIASQYPDVDVIPVCADFTRPFEVPEPPREPARTAVYFPGSTIGNFTRSAATDLLANIAELCAPGGGCLLGADLVKDRDVLRRAYDDEEGVTAAFNRNLLVRMNRELGADFDLARFHHEARWVEDERRIEMHLVSETEQEVCLGDETIRFAADESICTEHSHKYELADVARMAGMAGLEVTQVWTDPERLFSVQYLEAR